MLDNINRNYTYLNANSVNSPISRPNGNKNTNLPSKNANEIAGNNASIYRVKQATQNPQNAVLAYYGFGPSSLLQAYVNPSFIDSLAKNNSNVQKILDEHNVEYSVHVENIPVRHMRATSAIALEIAEQLGLNSIDKQVLEQAALFHDFGKSLIPSEVLNKPGRFTAEEREIMDLHSDLSYELLSQTKLNKRALNVIKNHHNAEQSNDILVQILSVADIYSALREERCYKENLSTKEAFSILDQKAEKGEVSAEVVDALKSIVYRQEYAA